MKKTIKAHAKLTPTERDDAVRLRTLFDRKTDGLSQAEFGATYGIGTQGMVWQYLSGTRRLNIEAVVKFARGLGVEPRDISPSLAAEMMRLASAAKPRANEPGFTLHVADAKSRPIAVMSKVEPDERGGWDLKDHHVDEPGRNGFVNVPSDDPQAFALRVLGDQLQPRVRAGEFLIIEPGHRVSPGDEVVVNLGNRMLIREYLFTQDGNVVLCAINGGHNRHTIAEKDVHEMLYVAAIVKPSKFVDGYAAA